MPGMDPEPGQAVHALEEREQVQQVADREVFGLNGFWSARGGLGVLNIVLGQCLGNNTRAGVCNNAFLLHLSPCFVPITCRLFNTLVCDGGVYLVGTFSRNVISTSILARYT